MAKKQSLGLVSVVVLAMFTAMAGCHKNDGTQEVDAAAANGNLAPVGDSDRSGERKRGPGSGKCTCLFGSGPSDALCSSIPQQVQPPQYPQLSATATVSCAGSRGRSIPGSAISKPGIQ